MKISGSFITMLIIWALGFTHFLGGPYFLFKFIFWIALLPFFISVFVMILMILKNRRLIKNSRKNSINQEAIHVEAEIKE
jgi:hypothetical protein